MRAIIIHQVKAYPSEKEGVRMVHHLQNMKQYVEDKVSLLGAMSDYNYCQTFVQGIKNSPVKKATWSENKKKKQERVYEEEEYEVHEDEKFDNMLGDYGKGKVDVKSRLGKISKTKPTNGTQPKDSAESEASASLGSFRRTILREIKCIFNNCFSVSFDFDYHSRTELLSYALQKLNKHIRQEKTKIWVIHLLFAIGHHVTLNEVLRKNKNSIF